MKTVYIVKRDCMSCYSDEVLLATTDNEKATSVWLRRSNEDEQCCGLSKRVWVEEIELEKEWL